MADPADNFHSLTKQPDDLLKEGLKGIDSRLLKTAVLIEDDSFIEDLLRNMNPMMLDMLLEDICELRDEKKHSEEESKTAQDQITNLYNKFVSTK